MTTLRANLPALTGLRFLAALHVFLFHVLLPRLAASRGGADGWDVRVIGGGYVGVSLFFVLSGFILAYVYLRPAADTIPPTVRMRGTRAAFFWARVARVYPVYAFALLVSAPLFAVTAWKAGRADLGSTAATALAAPFALQGWSPATSCRWNCPGWSLSAEAFFYAVFPAIGVWLCGLRPRARWAVALGAWLAGLALPVAYLAATRLAPAAATAATSDPWLDALKYAPPAHLGAFVVGVVVGLAFLAARREVEAPAWAGPLAGGALAAVALALAAGSVPYALLHNGLLVPLWGALVYALAWQRGTLARVLGHPLTVWLGETSYAFYLLHVSVFAYLLAVAARMPALARVATGPWVALVFAVSLAAAAAAHRWIEEPARRAIRARVMRDRSPDITPPGVLAAA